MHSPPAPMHFAFVVRYGERSEGSLRHGPPLLIDSNCSIKNEGIFRARSPECVATATRIFHEQSLGWSIISRWIHSDCEFSIFSLFFLFFANVAEEMELWLKLTSPVIHEFLYKFVSFWKEFKRQEFISPVISYTLYIHTLLSIFQFLRTWLKKWNFDWNSPRL